MRTHTILSIGLIAVVTASATGYASNDVQNTYEYEGRLLENGQPVNGRADIEFRLFTAVMEGEQVGPVLYADDLPVEDGAFFVTLDFGSFELDPIRHWLEMTVDGETLSPRRAMVDRFDLDRRVRGSERAGETEKPEDGQPVARAMTDGAIGGANAIGGENNGAHDIATTPMPGAPPAEGEGDLDDFPLTAEENDAPGGFEDATGIWGTRGNEYYYKRANVGVGTSNPAYPLDVRNNRRSRTLNVDNTDGSGTRFGLYARAKSTGGRGVYGYATASSGSTIGVFGRSNSMNGIGVYGLAAANQGTNYGIYGESDSSFGFAGFFDGDVRIDNGDLDIGFLRTSIGTRFFQMSKAGGGTTLTIDSDNSPFGGSSMEIRNAATSVRVAINGDSSTDGGEIKVQGSGPPNIRLRGSEGVNSGAVVELVAENGSETIELDSDNAGGGTAIVTITGTLSATIKNAIVTTDGGEQRLFYCTESPEVWFEDVGRGQLIAGEAHIDVDPLFLETVTISEIHPMHVLVTLTDDCNGVFVRTFDDHFVVKELNGGVSNATFSYKLICKRQGYEDLRLEPFVRDDDENARVSSEAR